MALHLYNTLSRQIEPFKPLRQDVVKIYYCGPTPYNFAHIGNLRAYLFEDLVVRTMRFLGYKVKTGMNITDIDDKTIRDSQKSGENLKDFTEKYSKEFLKDLDALHVSRADTIKPISLLIEEMQVIIQWLLDKGYAYIADDGSIYYRVAKYKPYGELAHLDMSGMKSNIRIDNDEYEKDEIADFALWKAYNPEKDGENFWEIDLKVNDENYQLKTPKTVIPDCDLESSAGLCDNSFGRNPETSSGWQKGTLGWQENESKILTQNRWNSSENWAPKWVVQSHTASEEAEIWTWSSLFSVKIKGRPGWHIECSACNYHIFGEQIDIHMGGIDNLFPHHQNEVAQTEAFTGKQFSKYWMHGGHLLVDNKKMAKSAGNFYTLRDIIEKNADLSPELVCRGFRLLTLQNKYRDNFNFTQNRLEAGIKTIQGFDETFKKITRYKGFETAWHTIARDFRDMLQWAMQDFVKHLENDFDSNTALTVIFEFQKTINAGMDANSYSLEEIEAIKDFFKNIDSVLALFDFSLFEAGQEIPEEIRELAEKRAEAKKAKDWNTADTIRDTLTQKWWKMIDEAGGKWSIEKI